ncbi:flagellar basal body P-ring formation chaperone FlgA [Vibrio sp. MEBiC08052]|uniref:flagellar basal body P-ring formation chaperone FlgA n=1 Tax=Vibrio sp. MEBiC08052 TaxID=1761910 RepID=UPI0007407C85|nr:flagellar basal body P-ring formation chaperone FlgA [Vibrio sp. MEBiC08052]KUI97026.1 hypothetical protein VRK_38810 [Vibrio sp. MEBiC08052]
MRVVWIVVACIVSFAAQSAEVLLSFQAPQIRLNDTATLAAMLTIRTQDADLKQKIAQIRLRNQDESIQAETVLGLIHQHLDRHVTLNWRGAAVATLIWQQRIDSPTIKRFVQPGVLRWVHHQFGEDADFRWRVEPTALFMDRDAKLLSFEIDSYRSNVMRLAGFFHVQSANGQRKYSSRYQIAIIKPVWVSTCSSEEGQRLNPACFALQPRAIDQKPYVSAQDDLQQLRALTSLVSGSVLLKTMVTEINLIESGAKVNAVYARRNVMIEAPAIARQAGNPGDKIKVFIPSIDAELQAVVTEKGSVVIDES